MCKGFKASNRAPRGALFLCTMNHFPMVFLHDLMKKMDRLLQQFDELHDADSELALNERYGSSLLVVLRPWELQYFSRLRRGNREKVFPE